MLNLNLPSGDISTDPTTVDTSNSDVGSGFDWSGLGDIFSSIGTTIVDTYRGVSTPSGPTVIRPGTVVYDPNSGRVISGGIAGSGSGVLLLFGGLIIVVLLLRK